MRCKVVTALLLLAHTATYIVKVHGIVLELTRRTVYTTAAQNRYVAPLAGGINEEAISVRKPSSDSTRLYAAEALN